MEPYVNPYVAEEGYFLHCVDPGGDTGLALLHIRPREFELVEWATVPYDPVIREASHMPTATLIAWTQNFPGIHRLLYEDFHLRNNSAEKDVTALKVIGTIDQMTYDRNTFTSVFSQEPVEAKHMVSDEVLEELDLHLGHQHHHRHVRDALRHGVTHLTRQRYMPVCRAAYPKGGGVRNPLRPGSRR